MHCFPGDIKKNYLLTTYLKVNSVIKVIIPNLIKNKYRWVIFN